METLILYIIKVNLSLVIFYLLYGLLFRKDTFIKLRRYYFLSVIIFSLSYPLFTVSALGNLVHITKEPKPVTTETSVYIGEISMGEMIVEDVTDVATPIDWTIVAQNILLAGIILLSLRFLWQLFSIARIKSHSEKRSLFGYLFYHLKDEITPFSFFSWIFVNIEAHNEKELKQILLHEHTHARQWHSVDILLVEMLRIAFWWNPIVWLMKRDIAINLEFLADKAVLQEGVECTEYQYHLLQLTNHETAVQIVNNFNVSQLKQRIIMMNSQKSPLRKLAKYLSVLPLALLLITANSVYGQSNETQEPQQEIAPPPPPVKKESKSDEVFVVVEKQPSFKEGVKAMMEFIEKEMKYPLIAKENEIQGRVIVNYIVEKDGAISDVQIVRGVDPSLDKEAIRIIYAMPNWNPGLQRDERVRVRYTLPISFKLYNKEDTSEFTTVQVKVLKDSDEDNDVVARGYGSVDAGTYKSLAEKFGDGTPLYIINDVKMEKGFEVNSISPTRIESISVLKAESAMSMYGEEGKDGVILITLKDKSKLPTTTANNVDNLIKSDKGDIFVVVENQPEFPGGVQALMKFLGDNVRYPVEAMKSGTQGRVITSFIINKDGSISDIEIERGVDPLLDAEAIRVIGMMPKWKPGTQKGQAVNVRFTIPVTFRLNNNEGEVNYEAANKAKETVPAIINNTLGRNRPLIIVDGKKMPRGFDLEQIKPEDIESSHFIQPQTAISTYADEGKDGVLLITTKKGPTLYNVREMNDLYEKGEKARLELNEKGEKARLELKEKGEKAREELKEKSGVIVYDERIDDPDKGFLKFIAKTIKYPIIAQENGIMGVSRATYDVDAKGETSNIKITESVDPSLDAELIRVTKLMPKDIALLRTDGKAASNIEISAHFRLQNGNGSTTSSPMTDVVVVGYGLPASIAKGKKALSNESVRNDL